MDNRTHRSEYRKAQRSLAAELLRQRRILRRVFNRAADQVAEVVRGLELSGASELTIAAQQELERALRDQAMVITTATREGITNAVSASYGVYSRIDEKYVTEAAEQAGVDDLITTAGMRNLAVAVDSRLIANLTARLYSDGFSLSTRTFRAGDQFRISIADTVSAGLAQGRDLFQIARDLEVYTAEGKEPYVRRYGDLRAGTRAFIRRIPRNIDYRAVRLVRSELYNSLQQASVQQGTSNPGGSGRYEWRLTPGVVHDCVCRDYAEQKYFDEGEVPEYPHPNCLCTIIPELRPQAELLDELRRWRQGGFVENINTWYNGVYIPAQPAA